MKKINLFDHLISLLVVILGISIAFYLEGYREGKAKKKQESLYVNALIEDMKVDMELLDTLLIVNRQTEEALIQLSSASIGNPISKDQSVTNMVLRIQYNPPFLPQRSTYESLKASGKMDLISDFELRNELVELYEQGYLGIEEYDDVIDEHIRDFIRPYYVDNVRYKDKDTIDESFITSFEFRNRIFTYRYLFISKNSFYEEVRKSLTETLEKFEEHAEDLAEV